jgi:hypothetical protein
MCRMPPAAGVRLVKYLYIGLWVDRQRNDLYFVQTHLLYVSR